MIKRFALTKGSVKPRPRVGDIVRTGGCEYVVRPCTCQGVLYTWPHALSLTCGPHLLCRTWTKGLTEGLITNVWSEHAGWALEGTLLRAHETDEPCVPEVQQPAKPVASKPAFCTDPAHPTRKVPCGFGGAATYFDYCDICRAERKS